MGQSAAGDELCRLSVAPFVAAERERSKLRTLSILNDERNGVPELLLLSLCRNRSSVALCHPTLPFPEIRNHGGTGGSHRSPPAALRGRFPNRRVLREKFPSLSSRFHDLAWVSLWVPSALVLLPFPCLSFFVNRLREVSGV